MANGPSQQKRDPHSVLIALAILSMVGFLVLYFKVDLDASLAAGDAATISQQIARLEMRMNKMGGVESDIMKGDSLNSKGYTNWDLKFTYPNDWYVTEYEDEFVGGQTNVRITSQPGELFLTAGGPGKPKAGQFMLGAQIVISELAKGQDFVGTRRLQTLPTSGKGVVVQKVVGECDGAGCPAAEYLVTAGATKYHAWVNIVGDDFVSDLAVSEAIITSLTK